MTALSLMTTRSLKRIVMMAGRSPRLLALTGYEACGFPDSPSAVNQPPDDHAQRAEQQHDAGGRLDAEAGAAFLHGIRIADHVEDAADDPDDADRGGDRVADIDREQPERRQEDRHPFQRVHLHAEHAFEVGMAGYRRQPDPIDNARPSHSDGSEEIEQDRETGDERSEMIHSKFLLLEHDPEKWTPVFRKDHAQTIS